MAIASTPRAVPSRGPAFEALQKEAASDPLLRDRLRLVFVSLDPALTRRQ